MFELTTNRFMIEGEGGIKYNYNSGNIASDPKLASLNFLNALERIPKLIEQYKVGNEKLEKDVPILQQTIDGTWNKEGELKELKGEVATLERKIQLSLKPVDQSEGESEKMMQNPNHQNSSEQNPEPNLPAISNDSISILHQNNTHSTRVRR